MSQLTPPQRSAWRHKLHEVIFEADTRIGRWFDIALLWAIVLSIVVVMLDSVEEYNARYGRWLLSIEWVLTIGFTLEYLLRLVCVTRPAAYARSFFGIVDLLAILPTYLSLVIPGSQYLLVVRTLRLLRVFRVLKLARFLTEANTLLVALRRSRIKITVFLGTVLTVTVIFAAMIYLVESGEPDTDFVNIPIAMYWTIVTVTTVGYGDIAPQTVTGRVLASALMIIGYAIIAVPTGIVSVEIAEATRASKISTQHCPGCAAEGHDVDARHCKFCGARL